MNHEVHHINRSVIPAQGTDAFFEAQVALLRAAGHFAEFSTYNEFGNNHSALWFVPTPGEQPERVFEGQNRHRNVWRLEVRLYGGNRVLMTITQDFANTQLPLEWLDPADYTPEVLDKWFKDFVAFAKQAASSKAR